MSQECTALFDERMKEIAREVAQEVIHHHVPYSAAPTQLIPSQMNWLQF